MSAPTVAVSHLSREFRNAAHTVRALDDISLTLAKAEVVALTGPSGSGKSTLLNMLVGLDRPTQGTVQLMGQDISGKSEDELAEIRARHVGFVFQDFHLLPGLTALENVMLPLELLGEPNCRKPAEEMLQQVGLEQRLKHYPYQLSGGEQQRVAIARAYVHHPRLLLADEPIGNLDYDTGVLISNLLLALNKEHNTTLLIATHDRELAQRAGRTLKLKAGKLQ